MPPTPRHAARARREADEKRRIAALEEARRREDAAAEEKLREERRIAALEEARRAEEKRKEEERLRLAALPDDAARAEYVRRVQSVLRKGRCYEGAGNEWSGDIQKADRPLRGGRRQAGPIQAKSDRARQGQRGRSRGLACGCGGHQR